jgi:hypothetical protein
MIEPSDDFVQYIQKLEKEKTGKELSHQEAEEAVNNLVGFFDLLYKIDCRNKNAKRAKGKKLLNDETISDEKAEKIRDECRDLAEIIFEKWLEEKNSKNMI